MIACKAWKQWKSRLVTEFVDEDKSPLELYPMIKKEEWAEFKFAKSTDEFKEMSKLKRKLAKRYKNHHKMGTAGYAGMSLKLEKRMKRQSYAGYRNYLENLKIPGQEIGRESELHVIERQILSQCYLTKRMSLPIKKW